MRVGGESAGRGIADETAWRKVCALVAGAALSPTVDVLRRAGALDRLASATSPLSISSLADGCGLHEGYAHVAFGLLVTQALAARHVPEAGPRAATIELTAAGRAWVRRCRAYRGAVERMERARALRRALLDGAAVPDLGRPAAGPGADALEARLALHACGPLVSSIVGALGRSGALRRIYHAPLGWISCEDVGLPVPALEAALPHLVALGWGARDGDLFALTPEGRAAARWAPLFNYVYGYLSVYERAIGLLRGESLGPPDQARDAADRDLLLAGKAYVFRTGLRPAFAAAIRPVLESGSRPSAVVDMNAGDGTVLRAVDELLGESAPRVRLVALVRNSLAGERCRATLASAAAETIVVEEDFTDADVVAVTLRAHGIELRETLVVGKTTIHDRGYRGAVGVDLPPAGGRPSEAVFVSPEGAWIEPAAMEDDLAAFFLRWRRHLGPHGLIAIDTHAAPPEVAARTWEENAVTHVAASHGYSSQYLIECDRFREAARRAGLSSRFGRDLGTDRVEAVTMSLDHFVP